MLKQWGWVNYQGLWSNHLLKSKKLSLLIVLVFVFTVIFPVSAAFAAEDNVSISGIYNYVKADDDTAAGIIRVKEDGMEEETNNLVIQLSLPDGVQFSDYSVAKHNYDEWVSFSSSTAEAVYVHDAGSIYFEFGLNGIDKVSEDAELAQFDFSKNVSLLNIGSEFNGNLAVAVDVIGLAEDANGQESILWTDNNDVTIAKVAGGDIVITASALNGVPVGEHKKVAKIMIEEPLGGLIEKNAKVTLAIETGNVEFTNAEGVQATGERGIEVSAVDYDNDYTKAEVTVINESAMIPGTITFDPIYLDIASNVNGDIKITVNVINNKNEIKEARTVNVATVGAAKAKIDDLENNDTIAPSGQITALDTSMKIGTGGTAFKTGGIMAFRLNKGEFVEDPGVNTDKITVKRYDYNKAFYVFFNKDTINFTLENLKIRLNNDVEPGDITLTITGDYGDLNGVIIGVATVPLEAKSTDPNDGATDIDNNITMIVSFNQKIFAGNDFSQIQVEDSNNNEVNVVVFIENNKLIVSPIDSLDYSTTYTVNIPGTAIKDLVGNTLTNEIKFDFTTEPSPNVSDNGGGGGGGGITPKKSTTTDSDEKINDLLENASGGDTITIDFGEDDQVISKETLRNISDIKCNLSVNVQDARTSLTFEPEALLTNKLEEMGRKGLIEISALTITGDEAKDEANYAISVGGKALRTYELKIMVKKDGKDEESEGTEIHKLNGNAIVKFDLSDMNLNDVDTELLTVIHQQPDGTWVEMETFFDLKSKTLSFTTNSLSTFVVIEKQKKEEKVTKLTIGQLEAIINGNPYKMDVKPYIDKRTNRTFVPLRFVSEALGAKVDWIAQTNNIVIRDVSKVITLALGCNEVLVNNDLTVINCAPENLPPGRVFVPLRFVSETLDAKVSYESSLKEITITKVILNKAR